MSKRVSTKRTYTKVGKHAPKCCPECLRLCFRNAADEWVCPKHGKVTRP